MQLASPEALRALARRSVEVIAGHQDVGGAYVASPTFPVYRYSWFRDGAFIADAMSRVGARSSADRFFRWCARVLDERRDVVADLVRRARAGAPVARAEHLPTRYTLDGRATGEPWWDFQLDGYGSWMWALVEHLRRGRSCASDLALVEATRSAVEICSDYLCAFWSEPCFDWWEEHPDRVHTSTVAAIGAGLRAVEDAGLVEGERAERCRATVSVIVDAIGRRGTASGRLTKSFEVDDRVDASLIACCTPLRLVDPDGPVAEATYAAVARDLAPDGVHRYLGDTYFGGGRWVVLAGFLGAHEAASGRPAEAWRRLRWMHDQATADGLLPEQSTRDVLSREHVSVWEERWGPVATPLLWSHAMYLTLADALGVAPRAERADAAEAHP